MIREKSLCDFVDDGILVIDRNMKIVFANRTLLRLCSLLEGDIVGIPCHLVFHQSLLPCTENCPYKDVSSTGKPSSVTYIHKALDGRERVFEVNATPVLDEKGEIAQMVEAIREVTERKKGEERPRNPSDFLHVILDAFNGGVAVIDRNMRVVMANRKYLGQEHLNLEEVVGKRCYEAFHHYTQPCHEKGEGCPAQDTFSSGLPSEAIHTYLDTKGKEHYVALKTYPIKDKNGKIIQVVETLYDITEKAENEIKEKIRILEIKEEIELLREELKRLRGSQEVISSFSK